MQANCTFLHAQTQGTHQQWGGNLLSLLVTVQEISRSCGSTQQISNKVLAPGTDQLIRAENQFPLNRIVFSPFPYFHPCTISTLTYSDHFTTYPPPSLFPACTYPFPSGLSSWAVDGDTGLWPGVWATEEVDTAGQSWLTPLCWA